MCLMLAAEQTKSRSSVRIVEVVLSLNLAITVGIAVSARYAWLLSHAEKWDTPAQMPALIICELPLALCLAALASGERSKRCARSAGLASGISLSFLVVALPLACDVGLRIWEMQKGYLVDFENFLPVCVLTAIWVLAAGWRYRRNDRRVFSQYAGIGVGCLVVVALLLAAASVQGSGEAKEKARYQAPNLSPHYHVRAVAACLIRHRFLHPQEGFPSSLSSIGADWNCDAELSNPWALHGYWIHCSGVHHGNSGFEDFRLESIPADRTYVLGPVSASDKRGEVFELRGLDAMAAQRKAANKTGHFSVQTVDADTILFHLLNIRGHIKAYMAAHDPANAPASLDGIVEPWELNTGCDYEDSAQERMIGRPVSGSCNYKVSYFLPSTTSANTFAISLECVAYGARCLRSYFLDYDGNIHATPEPRAATYQDPGLLPCESATICDDPIWTASEQPGGLTFMRASLLYSMHSTNWW